MGFGVASVGHGSCSRVGYPQLPIGVVSANITSVSTDGKRPVVHIGGSVNDKTHVNVAVQRTDLKHHQVYIQVTSNKQGGACGKVDKYSRDLELSDISTKLANIHGGERWTLNLVNDRNEVFSSSPMMLGGC
jgi:hypothetical protein